MKAATRRDRRRQAETDIDKKRQQETARDTENRRPRRQERKGESQLQRFIKRGDRRRQKKTEGDRGK